MFRRSNPPAVKLRRGGFSRAHITGDRRRHTLDETRPTQTLDRLFDLANFTPNSEQEPAIRHATGPLYITAGPGSGKTRVLLWRTLNLLVLHGIPPEDIYLSTFTEKAAHQLREGLRTLLAHVTNQPGPASFYDRHTKGQVVKAEELVKDERQANATSAGLFWLESK